MATAHSIHLGDGSAVVFDRKLKEAFVLHPGTLKATSPAAALAEAQKLVGQGHGVKLSKAQLQALSAALANVALLGG